MTNSTALASDDTTDDVSPVPAFSRMSATYSPEDNKLRLYTVTRLDSETYERVKGAGFKWAPRQELFVAPMWTPERAALLVELCGEIGDEDTSLVERAEERADRFEDYSAKRADDAHAAKEAVARIADGIPMGQPILVGHHSEKRARKDAERIQNGMRRAVDMWETSKYWIARAKGALAHAKYKERPDVRHRRIKGLESDKRKQMREIEESEKFSRMWSREGLTDDQAKAIANYDRGLPFGTWSSLDSGELHAPEASAMALAKHAARIEHARQWLAHIENRIAYERAMLDEQGGTGDKFPIEVGGRVLSRHWRACAAGVGSKGWIVVTKVNRDATGAIGSVSTTEGVLNIETITDYRAPEEGAAAAVKASKKLAPLVNYPGDGFVHMTQAEYTARAKCSDFYHVRKMAATDKHGAHRLRHASKPGGSYQIVGVYLTDAKRTDPPAPSAAPAVATSAANDEIAPEPVMPAPRTPRTEPARSDFDDMKDALRNGVAVVAVSAPELFPTPPDLAARMVAMAGVGPGTATGMRVLEPSAGTGNIVREIVKAGADVLAVEVNWTLAEALRAQYPEQEVCAVDFLELDDLGGIRRFDAVVMNPPFSQEIEHVRRAWELLRAGGVLVSIMSAGIRFRSDKKTTAFRAFVEGCGEIADLPDDSFKASGTSVRTVLVTMRKVAP